MNTTLMPGSGAGAMPTGQLTVVFGKKQTSKVGAMGVFV